MPAVSSHPRTPRTGASSARICISALSGGGGKTLLSLGLARAFSRQGLAVQPFKKGPDYIDAAWLSLAAGRQASNLDPYFLSPARLRALFRHVMGRSGARLALLEGNRGLFDGMDVRGSCATAELARTLDCPVLLSLDCTKMTRTAAALVAGVRNFEPGLRLAGVVLNQVASARHEGILREAITTYTDVPVLGAIPRLRENPLPERHMGLASLCGDDLSPQAQEILEKLADVVRDHVDMDRRPARSARRAGFLGRDRLGRGGRCGFFRRRAACGLLRGSGPRCRGWDVPPGGCPAYRLCARPGPVVLL